MLELKEYKLVKDKTKCIGSDKIQSCEEYKDVDTIEKCNVGCKIITDCHYFIYKRDGNKGGCVCFPETCT